MCKLGDWHFIIGVAAALSALSVVEPVVYSARPAEAQSGVNRVIWVEGNRRVEPETVRTYLRFNIGDAYDPAKVDQSIKSLFATGLFSDVRIDRTSAGCW
jgi:outer membrane protein insertion porin family